MDYLILGIITTIVLLLIIRHSSKRKLKKSIEEIRSAWGKPKTEAFYFNRIRSYADRVKGNEFHRLTEQTIEDIDLYGLFAFIDRTTSKVGQQFLFKKLIEPTNHSKDPAHNLVDLFTNDRKLREEIQIELLKLNNSDAYNIPSLLQGKLLERPKWLNLLPVNIVIMLLLFILSFKFPLLFVVLIIPISVNMLVHYWNKTNAFQFISSFPQLNLLIGVSRTLLKKNHVLHNNSVDESIRSLRAFQLNTAFINFENGGGVQGELNQLGTFLSELIKAFFLIEVFTFFKVLKELGTKQHSIITLFNYVGEIDASISIVSLRAGTSNTCHPVLVSARKEVFAKNMYHPLIEDCKKNNLTISGKSILITGSNMSGKSTFLRTLVINSILAQTIYTCFADEFVSPILKQFSSIRIDDDVFEGKSYFFQEVEIMGSLLAEVESSYQNLYVLDEVFKGTNTVERVSAAKAILSYLNRNDNIVVISTHDIELSEMLEEEYDLYHFTDTIENNELCFDYVIKRGQLTTRNAIRILEASNYPADIISEARQISTSLQTNRLKRG
jgi:hypothetical protein